MNDAQGNRLGILDNRFMSQSIGLLDPVQPLSLHQTQSVGDALAVLKEKRIGCVVITDEADRLVGIFTERDIILKLDLENLNSEQLLAELMTKDLKTASMTDSIAFVLQLMSQGGFRHVPIVDENNFAVGLISVKDIIDAVVNRITKEIANLAE